MSAQDHLSGVQFQHADGLVTAHHAGREVGSLDYFHTTRGELGVSDLYVDPAHRRTGVATGMFGALHQANPGKTVVHDEANMSDAALRMRAPLAERFPGRHRYSPDLIQET